MNRPIIALSALLFFSTVVNPVLAEGNNGTEDKAVKVEQVIVKLKDNATGSLKSSNVVSAGTAGTDRVVTVKVPANESVDEFIEDLEKRNDVESVEPDHLVRLSYTPNDPDVVAKQYHHQNIETKKAWDKSKGAADVVVAVIDDGIDMKHPDLKDQFIFPFDTVNETAASLPVGIHGTHVAGIIGSTIDNNIGGAGVAPHTKIMPINVFGGNSAYTSDIIQAIHYAVEKGADIINLSLGSYVYNAAFNDAIQFAHKNGVVIVAAAGNEGVSKSYYPASYANVISVGSTTSKEVKSTFSNYGEYLDLVAPGSFVYSTLPNNGYGMMSGTSMASPIVAGVAALIMAAEPVLTNVEIENRLFTTADDLGEVGKDSSYGNGRVNARKALKIDFLPAPYVLAVYDYSANVSGTTEAGATIEIKNESTFIASGMANTEGKFTIAIPKQSVGKKLFVTSTNATGAISNATELIVKDGTRPVAPIINTVSDNATSVTGTAEANAKVIAVAGSKKLGESVAAKGVFAIDIAKQVAGTIISVYAVDAAGNKSVSSSITVIDKTAPAVPTVNAVGDNAVAITGKAETNARIIAFIDNQKLGEIIAENGAFTMPITKQQAGTAIVLYAIDAAGNKSAGKTIKVIDKTAPAVPTVRKVSDKTTAIKGKAEANAKVFAYSGSQKLGEAIAKNGLFSIKIVKQKAASSISVYAVDAAGNKSGYKTIKVLDKTAPAIPSINTVTTSATMITGKASTNSRVYAYAGKKKLGEAIAKKGAYSIKIAKQKTGTVISVFAEDTAKNRSATKAVNVAGATKMSGKYQASANLNLRSGSSIKFKAIGIIPKGKTVECVAKSGNWYKVKYGSKTGWVSSYYLQKYTVAAPQTFSAYNVINPYTKAFSLSRKSLKRSYVLKNTTLGYNRGIMTYTGSFKIEFLLGSLPNEDVLAASKL